MKRIISLTAAVFFMASATQALADGIYVSGFAGLNILPSEEYSLEGIDDVFIFDYESGYSFGAAIGTRLTENLRAEIEVSRFSAGVQELRIPESFISNPIDGDVQGVVGLANLWFDVPNDTAFSPYAGLGLGIGHATMDTEVPVNFPILTRSDFGLAAQAGAGVRFAASDNMTIDLGYRFKTIPDLAFFAPDGSLDTTDFNVNMHQFQLGLTYAFD
jgi:opacity protein-like surface antigen